MATPALTTTSIVLPSLPSNRKLAKLCRTSQQGIVGKYSQGGRQLLIFASVGAREAYHEYMSGVSFEAVGEFNHEDYEGNIVEIAFAYLD